ncbi:MAG: mannose-6-phosphate isomerase, class I, partial [Actinomycetota bacterium]
MLRLKGVTQHYSWGDRYALPTLLDITADGRPWAEIWYGTHPRGKAQVDDSVHLPAPTYLADEVGDLPFIVKLLAAAQPLSLQTHPSAEQAKAGFAREEAAGIAHDAKHRVYADDRAKPEMIVAISMFEALCGFVTDEAAIAECEAAGARDVAERVRRDGVAGAAEAILRGERFAEVKQPSSAMRQLDEHYSDSRSLIALLMHHVRLQPGEAMYLDAGNVHTYLYGMAVEVQGSSDNVVRAAFTDKHVDLAEFFAVARLASTTDPRLLPKRVSDVTSKYECAAPFQVMRHEINGSFALTANRTHTLMVCASGRSGSLTAGAAAYVARGESVVLEGTATIYTVSA